MFLAHFLKSESICVINSRSRSLIVFAFSAIALYTGLNKLFTIYNFFVYLLPDLIYQIFVYFEFDLLDLIYFEIREKTNKLQEMIEKRDSIRDYIYLK